MLGTLPSYPSRHLFGQSLPRRWVHSVVCANSWGVRREGVIGTVGARKTKDRPKGNQKEMPEAELDLRLHRLLFLADGIYAIAATLLAVELVLPEAAADLHGREL